MASSLVSIAHGAFSYAKDRAVNVGYGPVTLLAKTAIIGMFVVPFSHLSFFAMYTRSSYDFT